ncbi:roadblock/LC7 domain-containing protein [Salinibacterium sp. ZJ70]|uniref:roadblock/LC7 domain-containing protein n=1 Tax=Salinibacterium sp. ZJ70 TaxID=2708084 RepID=UPI0014200C31|nr:roadblock/LC7 domain-containing protein [Salinibacterium sp. ZJ70]
MTYDAPVVPTHRHPQTVEAATDALVQLREACPSFTVAVVLSDDGFEIARDPATSDANQRLASMASSLQALAEAIAKELALGATRYALIEAEDGHVLLLRVPEQPIVLAAVFGDEETSGKALLASRRVITDFAAQLAASTHPTE